MSRSGTAGRAERAARGAAALLPLALFACRSTPAPPDPGPLALPPELECTLDHHSGSLLAGPRPAAPPGELDPHPDGAWSVHVRLMLLERMPSVEAPILAPNTELLATPGDVEPLAAAGQLARGTRWARGAGAAALLEDLEAGAAGRTRVAHEARSALPQGCVLSLGLANVERVEDPDNFLREWAPRDPVAQALELHVARETSGEARVALVLQGLAPPRGRERGEETMGLTYDQRARRPRPGAPQPQRELLLPGVRALLDETPLVLLVPSPFAGGEGDAFLALVELAHAPALGDPARAEHDAALQRVLADVSAARERVASLEAVAPAGDAPRLSLTLALRAIDSGPDPRAALVHLAGASGARLLADLALDADAETLPELVAELVAERDVLAQAIGSEAEAGPARLGWALEREAWDFLARRALVAELAPELEALLLRHAGEVGRFPSVLQGLLEHARERQAFDAALVEEQLFFLEDASPAARVRAFDWLSARSAAPAGYGPLDGPHERRAALEAARGSGARPDGQAATPSAAEADG